MSTYTLRTRPPTGRVPWPLILVEGGEKSGKSWSAAVLSSSPRVGRTFWIDLAEGAGDEYGAIPGTRYEVVKDLDGKWENILAAVEQIRDEARRSADAGEPPTVIVIDSMTLIWDMLKDWATNRAKDAPSNKKRLREDPNAEIVVSTNFWNDANSRHRRLMTLLMTFPGIAVATARGKEVAEMGSNGAPIPGRKVYRVEGHKDLAFDASVWVRLSRTDEPVVVGARSVHAGIVPGSDRPKTVPGLTLEQLIFDILKCDPVTAHTRDLVELKPGDAAPATERSVVLATAIADAPDEAALRRWWEQIGPALDAGDITEPESRQLADAVRARKAALEQTGQPGVSEHQHRRMHAIWRKLGKDGDANRDARLERIREITGRQDLTSSKELTEQQADLVINVIDAEAREQRREAIAS